MPAVSNDCVTRGEVGQIKATNIISVFTLNIGTALYGYLLTILVLKCERSFYDLLIYLKTAG